MRTPILSAALALALATPAAAQQAPAKAAADPIASTEGLDMQVARGKMMGVRGQRVAYTRQFDLSGLPAYQPKQQVTGTIRFWGSNYITDGRLGGFWAEAFKRFHPGVTIEWHMKTTTAAVPSLVFGVSDIGLGRKVTFSELQLFQRYTDRDPFEISVATGSYDVPGWNPGFGVLVSKDNPLRQITMEQLDYIFGAERTGGWEGTNWRPQYARGPEKNIRTWGQLGLTGKWAKRPINVYGLNLRYHQTSEISDWILHGSDKWNEHLKIYANAVSTDGKLVRGMNDDMAADPYAIGIVAAPTTDINEGSARTTLKMLPLAQTSAGPFVPYTLDTIHDRSYPLYDAIYAYADVHPGAPADPKVTEFLRFILSREGQAAVMKDAKYLPLTAEVVNAGLAKLDAATAGK